MINRYLNRRPPWRFVQYETKEDLAKQAKDKAEVLQKKIGEENANEHKFNLNLNNSQ